MLARHHFILLGLRGQAKTRILRALTTLLDEWLPVIPDSEINDDPIAPLSAFGQQRVKAEGDEMPIRWLPREARYVEKLATPDVTIADMIGDIDPIKAAKGGLQLGSELSMHFGLLPRANRGIFAINELPDLAGKIQVGLFNILQEGDVQIKGYPVRLPLDVMIAFTANPEDYTARGKIITPLKDRIGAEIRTHYMQSRADAMTITEQEAWVSRGAAGRGAAVRARGRRGDRLPGAQRAQDRQAIGRQPAHADQRPRNRRSRTPSAAPSPTRESPVVPRVTDIYAALPSMTGKFELEYEGELKGADQVARDLVRAAVANVFEGYFADADARQIIEWFDLGGSLSLSDTTDAATLVKEASAVQGLVDLARRAGVDRDASDAGHRLGDRFPARRPVLAEEDQPQRRPRLPRRRTRSPPAAADANRDSHAGRRRGRDDGERGGRRSITTDACREPGASGTGLARYEIQIFEIRSQPAR